MTRSSRLPALLASFLMLVFAGAAFGEPARYLLTTPGVV